MKKILALVAVALLGVASTFALDLSAIQGTWKDANWDANWTFNANGTITLTDAKTGKVYYTFTENNVSDFQVIANTSGAGFSFYCKNTGRSYKFIKGLSLSTDITMTIDPDWESEDYSVTMQKQ